MRQGHRADAIAELAGLARSLYMSQLTGGVSDLQQCSRSRRRRLSGKPACGWSNRAWICLNQRGPVGLVNRLELHSQWLGDMEAWGKQKLCVGK